MKKQLLGILFSYLFTVSYTQKPVPTVYATTPVTPLVFGASGSTLSNLTPFVGSVNHTPGFSNRVRLDSPGSEPVGGVQRLFLSRAGDSFYFNSLFLRDKIDVSHSTHKGFSTFMELSMHKGEFQWAGDGFSLVLARDDFRVKARHGYGSALIDNSLAVRFSNWRGDIGSTGLQSSVARNGLSDDASLIGEFKNLDVELGTISPGIGSFGLLRTYKIWIDLDGETGNLEIRIRFDNSFERPTNPTASYTNISMEHLTDQFYAGITVSSGGLTMGLYLDHLYSANQYLPNGIDMTNLSQYVVDKVGPSAPLFTPIISENGYKLNANSTDNIIGDVFYEFKVDENPYVIDSFDKLIPFGARQVRVKAFDRLGNRSTETIVNFLKATYHDPFGDTLEEQWYPTSHPLELLSPTRTGYTFGGWYSEDTLVNEVTQLSTSADLMLFPKWIADPYTIQFETNGGSDVTALTQGFETTVNAPSNPTKLGHTFDGWFADESLTTPYTFSTMPMNDVTLYAKWLVNSYAVRYETFGGNVINDAQVSFGNQVTSVPTPTKDHAFFDGWYLDSELTQPFAAFAMPAEDVTLYAAWVDATPVENLIAMVEAWPDPVDLGYAQSLLDAKALLASLSTKQGTYVPEDIREAIERAEIRIHNLTVVANTEALFDPLPNPVTLEDAELVASLREEYNALNSDQKALFDSSLLQRLVLAETRITDLNIVASVAEQFIFNNPITLADEDDVVAIREAYEDLTNAQKALFDEALITELERVEEILRNLRIVQTVVDQINNLSVTNMDDVGRVGQARGAYDNLTPEQQAMIDEAILALLAERETEATAFVELVNYRNTSFSILVFHLVAGTGIAVAFYLKKKKTEAQA